MAPRFDDLDTRVTRALGAALRILMVMLPIVLVVSALAPTTRPGQLSAIAMILAVVVVLHFLHSRGHVRTAAYGLVIGLIAFSTAAGVAFGSMRGAASLGYFIAIVVGGIVLGGRTLAAATLVSSLCIGALIGLENADLLPAPDFHVGVHHWVIYSVALAGIAGLIFHTRRLLVESLARVRAGERRMDAMFRASPAALIVTRADDGCVLEVNEAYERLFGFERDGVVGRTVNDLGIWETFAERDHFLALLKTHRRVSGHRTRLRRRDGVAFDALVASEFVPGAEGTQILSSVVDLTEELRAREALQQSERRFRVAFESSPIGMTMTRLSDGRFLAVNRADKTTLGYTPDELLRQNTVQSSWLSAAEREAFIAKLRAERSVSDYQVRLRHRDGSIADCALWAAIVEIDGEPCVLTSIMNVTEAKRVEEELRASRRLLEQVIDAIPMAIFAKDLDSNYVMVNRYMADFFGTTKEGLLKRHTSELPSREATRAQSLRDDNWVFEHRRPLVHETRIQNPDGVPVPYHSSKIPLFDESGSLTGLLGVNRDITQELEAQRRIEEANATLEARVRERTAQLEAANAELEAFSYSVSHDLKAPLRAIDGAAGILRAEHADSLPPEAQSYLQRISGSVRQMGALIDGLLEFARLSRQSLTRRVVQPEEILRALLQDQEDLVRERRVEIQVAPLPACFADPLLLRQVLSNLLSNALKYSARATPPRVELGTVPAEGGIAYFIRDNGVGFDMAYAHRLGGVFERLHAVREFEGTGIGLALVKRIVARHGGRLWAESAPGRGATFYFTIGTGGDGPAAG